MGGMFRNYVSVTNPTIVALFHHHLYGTATYWIVGIGIVLLLAATLTRRLNGFNLSREGLSEPRARTLLRIAFGCIWLFDGILQFQPAMPLGLANEVVQPTVSGAPSWLRPLQMHAIHLWNAHPIALATGTAWIQVGIGLALIVSNGGLGRLAGIAAAGWAALIWLIGNGAGGAFAPASSILFGWPGATLFYFVAAVWIALPPGYFAKHFSGFTLRFIALILAIAIVLQVLPSAGFWHGGNKNALTAMSRDMTQTAQPHALSWIVLHVGTLAGTLGGGFNVIVILWLGVCAAGLWYASSHQLNWPIIVLAVGCVFFWITGEDLAIFGGVGTDINSLIPLAVLAWCARPALRSMPPLARHLPEEFRSSTGAVVAAFATGMILFSVVSMGVASVSAAEPTLYVAQNGTVAPGNNAKAPTFTLTDQFDKPFTLSARKGYYTLLTFLDPVCWTDCPLLAAQLKQVRADLPTNAKIDIVAVAANPLHQTLADVRHFIKIHYLSGVKNFYYVTGPTSKTRPVWRSYGIEVENVPGDLMSIHSDEMVIINGRDQLKWIIPDDPLKDVAGQESAESELLILLHKSGLD
jgi:cytochrome oxidase Cu insertion factor (SCO1/SenC/PrrC family)